MDGIQARSKRLFNRENRLAVIAAIAETKNGEVVTKQLAGQLGLDTGPVNDELHVLAELGLLVRAPEPGKREVPYRRVNTPFWRGCHALLERWKSEG
jgi:Mn-dependent DtxR family transcriptional regulator